MDNIYKQKLYISKMYECIDNNDIDNFIYYFNEWHLIASLSDEQIQLDDEIKQYAKNNCIEQYNMYYD